MRRPSTLLLCLPLTLAACSSGGGDDHADAATADAAGFPDAAAQPDATIPPDAAPPDANPANLSCLGAALPDTADDPVTISGDVFDPGVPGFIDPAELAGILIDSYKYGDELTPIDSDVSAGDGTWSLTATTNALPLDAYIRARQDAVDPGQITTYVYPAVPTVTSATGIRIPMIAESTLALLANFTGLSQDDTKGLATVIVVDCDGNPVQGAVVTSTPAAGQLAYLDSSGLPSTSAGGTDASGLAFLLDLPISAGTSVEVEVGAALGSDVFRAHTVTVPVYANGNEHKMVTTQVAP